MFQGFGPGYLLQVPLHLTFAFLLVFPCLLMINDVYELRRSYFVGFLDWLFVYNLAGFTFAVSVYKISVDVTSILSILGSS